MLKKFIAALGLLACSTVSLAQSNAEGFYVGLSAGKADLDTHKFPGLTYTRYDHEDTAYKLFAGYSFNKLLSAELSYNNLGTGNSAIVEDGGITAQTKVRATVIALKISPMSDALISPFVKVGASHLRNKETSSEPASGKKSSVEVYYGLGAEYALGKSASLVLEYENFGKNGTVNENSTDPSQVRPKVISLGVKFGL
jgi:OOP family OmpA-OmpF porin